tara:strand:+ start:374 stop:895 length:522 start_codon:yes stop_codon:yes gene_type:complete
MSNPPNTPLSQLKPNNNKELTNLAATLTFRISGQGEKLYGDGISLWLTQDKSYKAGSLHGVSPKFTGMGIIIDTFKNVEHGQKHRDVTIVFNDGTKVINLDDDEKLGCNIGKMRYHEERDDFSVFNTSRIRLMISPNKVLVEVDPEGENKWQTCLSVTDTDKRLPKDWLKKSR